MKVYVENGDIPKRCIECRFCYYSEDEYHHCCRINGIDIENKKCWRETHPDCPLLSISDYTKQVRKEVCEEIKSKIVYYAVSLLDEAGNVKENVWGISKKKKDVDKILDQIQGETK